MTTELDETDETTEATEIGAPVTIRMTWSGASPLVVHNSRLANPTDEHGARYKALSSKSRKSDDDRAELAKVEFYGGLYMDEKLGPVIPAENIEKCLVEGARKHKKGKDVESLVMLADPVVKIDYKGPRTVESMHKARMFDVRLVGGGGGKKGGGKVLRTRPMFQPPWSLTFDVLVDPEIDAATVIQAAEVAGKWIGIGARHFRWGRFTVAAKIVEGA